MRDIPLTKGKVTIVDDSDYEHLSMLKWHYCNGYARHHFHIDGKWKAIKMEKYIMRKALDGEPENTQIDHIDRNKLNNQRHNFRFCGGVGNSQNRNLRIGISGYRGVHSYWNKRRNIGHCWEALITACRERIFLGCFYDPIIAARAYDIAARELHGEFAILNFPHITPDLHLENSIANARICRSKKYRQRATTGVL